jgi:pimeloyl-ACP methyl ester carboxylesterase
MNHARRGSIILLLVAAACVAGPKTRPLENQARSQMKTFKSKDGADIACFVSGSGTPLVLIHGTSADHGRWGPILPALERRFTVYACDRRGRGSSGDGPAYAIEREFEDIAAVIDGIGGPVDVLAHSYGAMCTLEAARLTTHLRRLVLYEPPIPSEVPIYPEGIVDRLQAMLDAGERDRVVSTFMSEIPRVPPAHLEKMRSLPAWPGRVAAAHTIVRELRAHQHYNLDGRAFRTLKTPTLLLLGGASPPFFRAALDKVQAALPDTRLVVLPDQSHVAIDTVPDLFAREVLAFLDDRDP